MSTSFSASSTSTYNPLSTATTLANAYIQPMQSQITSEQTAATAKSTALTTLQSALTAFDTAVTGLSAGTGVTSFTSTLSNPAIATATASATATAGSYSFFVKQLATAQQMAYANVPTVSAANAGTLNVSVGSGTPFAVNLSAADTSGDGTVSPTELAAAINGATGNNGQAVASVITAGSQTELVVTAGQTGLTNTVNLDLTHVASSSLSAALTGGQLLSPPSDAIVDLGGATGLPLSQASNTFTSIAGVSVTFTQAQNTGDTPVTLTVASDAASTAANVQSFVTAYNTVQTALSSLTSDGNPTSGTAAGEFANDSGVLALQSKLTQFIRQDFKGQSLVDIGVSADQYGTLSLDQTKLTAALTANPAALSNVFGGAGYTGNTGLLGGIDTYLQGWLTAGSGQISQRQTSVQATQTALTASQTQLTTQYNDLYQKYLTEFTNLQTLQSQLAQSESLFTTATSSTTIS
jgi:flagellar hook-associated protein 2